MKNFKFSKSIMLIMVAIVLSLSFNSCEDNAPACEKNNTGNVKVVNGASYFMTVDVWDNYLGYFLGERVLSPHSSTTYYNVHAGYIEVYETDVYIDYWVYWSTSVSQCKTLEFTIYNKKSSNTQFNSSRKISK
jgi:hypothetical protein